MVEPETFVRYVQECLGHLHDLAYLEAHPLARLVPEADQAGPAEALRRALVDAIDRLRPVGGAPQSPLSAQWRRYRYLCLRYEEGLTLHQAARELGVSSRQASRDQQQAVQALASLLWARHLRARAGPVAVAAETEVAGPVAGDGGPTSLESQPDLDAELRQLAKLPAEAPTDLEETVRGVVATIGGLAESRGVTLELSFSDTVSRPAIGRTLLRQALFNLLSYAIELTSDSRILISAADTARGVELSLDARCRQRRQVARSARSTSNAEALLTAGRRLLETQGGAIELCRHADDSLTIDLVLPPIQMRKVLVIDDNPDVVGLFRRYLRHANYRLVYAGTAESALRLAAELRPEIITLDLMMPTQDGWEILQQLRSCEVTRDIPIVVCSVLPEKALALSLGVAGFLAKPITRASLLAALERCLQP